MNAAGCAGSAPTSTVQTSAALSPGVTTMPRLMWMLRA